MADQNQLLKASTISKNLIIRIKNGSRKSARDGSNYGIKVKTLIQVQQYTPRERSDSANINQLDQMLIIYSQTLLFSIGYIAN